MTKNTASGHFSLRYIVWNAVWIGRELLALAEMKSTYFDIARETF
jgi:hypothetical protein